MPPSNLNYYNQTGPFWDFVADFERAAGNRRENADNNDENPATGNSERAGEYDYYPGIFSHHHGGPGFPFGPLPFGRRPPHHHPDQPHPPPPPGFEEHPFPHEGEPPQHEKGDEDHPMPPPEEPEQGEPSDRNRHRGGPHRRRSSRSPHGGPRGPHGHWGRRGFGCRGNGRHGGGHPRPPFFMRPGDANAGPGAGFPFANLFGPWIAQFGGFAGGENNDNNNSDNNNNNDSDFTPEADVFDTETAFVIHVSLPGAKKEDVGVNWDADKSEISVGGVVYRPGDEEFLKTLAMGDRKAGPFEKKIRLGSRANPAQVDADMITAKLEDGILRVHVPKLDKDYVEIKKVDIE